MSRNLYYQHSGEFNPLGILLTLVVGLLSAVLLGYVYAYLILYIPLAGYITFILSLGFGALVGLATSMGLTWGKVRNNGLALGLGLIVGLVALYTSWAVWIHALMRQAEVESNLLTVFSNPSLLLEIVSQVNENGAWSISGFSPTGTVLWLLWGLEAVLILGPAILLPMAGISSPFCERCNVWCDESKDVLSVAPTDSAELVRRMESKDLDFLQSLEKAPPGGDAHVQLDLHSCPTCKSMHTLSLKQVTVSINDKGERSESTEDLMTHLLIDRKEAEAIRQLASS